MLVREDVEDLVKKSAAELSLSWSKAKLNEAREVVLAAIAEREAEVRAAASTSHGTDAAATDSKKRGKSRWDSDSDSEEEKAKKRKNKKPRVKESSVAAQSSLSNSPCRPIGDYELLETLQEGTYGEVIKAIHLPTNEPVALKRIKYGKDKWEGFSVAALRETNVLFNLKHPNLVQAREMVVGLRSEPDYPSLEVYLSMNLYMCDMHTIMKSVLPRPLQQSEVKLLMRQLLSAVSFLHENWFMHRDLKLSNLLYNPGGHLVVCDFGLTRQYSDPPGDYTNEVVTLHYRSPELLLGVKDYNGPGVDLWSVGCIFAELITKTTLFPGEGVPEQLNLIWHLLGTPVSDDEPMTRSWPAVSKVLHQLHMSLKPQNERRLRTLFPSSTIIQGPYLSDVGFDLLEGFLMLDPEKRRPAGQALSHPWFTQEEPKPKAIGEVLF